MSIGILIFFSPMNTFYLLIIINEFYLNFLIQITKIQLLIKNHTFYLKFDYIYILFKLMKFKFFVED